MSVDDAIVLFTDGLFEVTGDEREEFGQERLLEAVRRRTNSPLSGLFDDVLEEVRRFSSEQEFEDDVCLLGIEVARLGHAKGTGP